MIVIGDILLVLIVEELGGYYCDDWELVVDEFVMWMVWFFFDGVICLIDVIFVVYVVVKVVGN